MTPAQQTTVPARAVNPEPAVLPKPAYLGLFLAPDLPDLPCDEESDETS